MTMSEFKTLVNSKSNTSQSDVDAIKAAAQGLTADSVQGDAPSGNVRVSPTR